MQARTRWWLIGILVLVIAAAMGVFEPIKFRDRTDPNTGETIPPVKQIGPVRLYRPHFGITLGLDLRGGSHLVLQAQGQALYEFVAKELSEPMSDEEHTALYGEVVNLLSPEAIGTEKRDVQLRDDRIVVQTRLDDTDVSEQAGTIANLLATRFSDVEMKVAESQPITRENLTSIERIIEERVNAYGVTEPVIQRQPPDRLIVELPGIKDPQ